MTKTRNLRFDNIKFFLILLVVLGHVAERYTDMFTGIRCIFTYIYTFHMPAFLFIAGLFAKRTIQAKKLNWNRVLPYAVLCIFLSFYRNVSLYLFNHDRAFHIFRQDSISWFLWVLFVYYIVTFLLKDFPHKNVLIIAVLFALMAGFDTQLTTRLAISRTIVFYPFFYLGYMLKTEDVESFLDMKILKVLSALWLVIYGVFLFFTMDHGSYLLRKFFTGQNSYQQIFGEDLQDSLLLMVEAPGMRAVCLFLTLVTTISFMALVPKGHIPFVSNAGQRTISVYFWHLPVITILCNMRPVFLYANSSLLHCCIVCAAMAVVLTILFSLKCFSIPMEWVLHPGKRKEEKTARRQGKKLIRQLKEEQAEVAQKEQTNEMAPMEPSKVLLYSDGTIAKPRTPQEKAFDARQESNMEEIVKTIESF